MWKRTIGVSVAGITLVATLTAQTAHAPMRISGPPPGSASHHRMPRALYPGFPLWADSYFPANDSAPSVVVVQPPAAPLERVTPFPDEPKSAAPLLIEWQGDRYVRRTSTTTGSRDSQPDYVADTKSGAFTNNKAGRSSQIPSKGDRPSNLSELPPTAFIFRDGHREESDNYSIISGVIYARGDYWATGQWSKQIKLSQLDLPATIKANQQQGITFRIPAAPNEVITRP